MYRACSLYNLTLAIDIFHARSSDIMLYRYSDRRVPDLHVEGFAKRTEPVGASIQYPRGFGYRR